MQALSFALREVGVVQPAVGQVGCFFASGSPSRPAGCGRERLVEVKILEAIMQLLEGGDHGEGVALGAADGESAQVPSDVFAHFAQCTSLVALVDDAPGGVALDDGDDLGEAGAAGMAPPW